MKVRIKFDKGYIKMYIVYSDGVRIIIFLSNKFRAIKSRRMKYFCYAARMREMKNAYQFLFGELLGNSPLEVPRHRYESTEMDLNVME
jgi:hypothetical protein